MTPLTADRAASPQAPRLLEYPCGLRRVFACFVNRASGETDAGHKE
jgi:hypothetical protein